MARAQTIALPVELCKLLDGLAGAQVADDQRWILALMRKSGLAVLQMLWRLLGTEADVLDAYQSAVCSLTAKGRDHVGRNSAGYFYRTAMNAAIETLRARRLRQQHWPRVVESQRQRADDVRPEQAFDQRRAAEQLREAVCQLPPHLRGVIVMRDLAGMSYREVARVLGIRVGTARLYRRQAVVRLADLLGEEARP